MRLLSIAAAGYSRRRMLLVVGYCYLLSARVERLS